MIIAEYDKAASSMQTATDRESTGEQGKCDIMAMIHRDQVAENFPLPEQGPGARHRTRP